MFLKAKLDQKPLILISAFLASYFFKFPLSLSPDTFFVFFVEQPDDYKQLSVIYFVTLYLYSMMYFFNNPQML